MIFDINIYKVNSLTQAGKEKLSDIFFGDTSDNIGAKFNSVATQLPSFIDTDKYRISNLYSLKDIYPTHFRSRVDSEDDFYLNKILFKNGSMIPFFSSGTALFHRYKSRFSNDLVRLLAEKDEITKTFKIKIPINIDVNSINIFTSKLTSGGTIDIDNEYIYKPLSSIPVVIVESEPLAEYKFKTFVIKVDSEYNPIKLYETLYNNTLYEIADENTIKHGPIDDMILTLNIGDFYIDPINSMILFKTSNGDIIDYRISKLFSSSTNDCQFTFSNITDSFIEISLNSYSGENVTFTFENLDFEIGKSKVLFFDKYPVTNHIINEDILSENNISFKFFDNCVRLTNNSGINKTITVTVDGMLTPIIEYDRNLINKIKDNKHMKIDVSPKSTSFNDGIVCLSNAEISASSIVDTIDIKYASNTLAPFSSTKVTAITKNQNGVLLPHKNIKLTILDDLGGLVKWNIPADENNSIEGTTNFAGEFSAAIVNENVDVGYYIQKEWVGEITDYPRFLGDTWKYEIDQSNGSAKYKTVYIPADIGTINIENVGLFFVTADDPILSQIESINGIYGITADKFSTPQPYDYYVDPTDITSYKSSGRNIAYVQLSADQQVNETEFTVKSKFIKPISIEVIDAQREFYGRLLYKYSPLIDLGLDGVYDTILSDIDNANFSFIDNSTTEIFSSQASGYNSKWLLSSDTDSKFGYFKFTVDKYTKLTFESNIPGRDLYNIIGYYLRVMKDESFIPIKAEHYDEFLDLLVEKEDSTLELKVLSMSVDEFTLSTEISSINSYIGQFSYLTITEYSSNKYGTNFATPVCKYSSRIISGDNTNRCMHPNQLTRDYYRSAPDSISNLYCGHNIEVDLTLPDKPDNQVPSPIFRCPGLDQILINPFVLYTS